MTLARKAGLLAAACLLPPTLAISGFTTWTGARQIEELTLRNLNLELARFQQRCQDEYQSLKALAIDNMDFYRQNAKRKMIDWAKSHPPPSGFLTISGPQGERILAPTLPADQTLIVERDFGPWEWTLGAAVSKQYLDSFGRQALWNTLWIDLIAVLPLLLATLFLSRSISRPVDRLRLAAEALSRGDFSVRAQPSGTPEIQTLAKAFNTMADHIQGLTEGLEDRVRARTEDLERSQHEMARKERLASLGALVGGVAHEINTPLGICVTSASTLANEAARLDAQYRSGTMAQRDFEEFLATLKEGMRLLDLNLSRANDLVASFKRLSVNQLAEQRREFSPAETLADIVASLAHELKVAAVNVEVSGGEGLRLRGDPGLLSQVVLNWLMNSLIHGFDQVRGGTIRIQLFAMPDALVLDYEDDGKGMDAPTLERLYEPFFTTKPGVGSGLGMSLVYTIVVSRLGGTIEAQSSPGQGARFHATIPFSAGSWEPVSS